MLCALSVKAEMIRDLVEIIKCYDGRPITLMEVCGTHTMSIAKIGLKDLLPQNIRIVSGPGCPVCVTHQDYIEKALMLAQNAKICTFGDLVRVPGSLTRQPPAASPAASLAASPAASTAASPAASPAAAFAPFRTLAEAPDVQMVYSPLECIKTAQENPQTQVVFLSIGFETTTPSVALAVRKARELGLTNLTFLTANKTMPNVMEALLSADDLNIDGLIYPGHVSAIEGTRFFDSLSRKHKIPGVVAGFEPKQVLMGVCELIDMIEKKDFVARNVYKAVVREDGNPLARQIVGEVFEPVEAYWRGFGMIPGSGLGLRAKYKEFDAEIRFEEVLKDIKGFEEPKGCRCGDVLKGKISPRDCKLFGTTCTQESPIGACMVSSEGSCAAEFRYGGLR